MAEVKIDEKMHPNLKKGIEVTRELAKEERKARLAAEASTKELQAKYKEAEDKLKSAPLPESVKQELESLRQMRRDIDIRNDPEFHAKYVQGIRDNEESIFKILQESNLRPETAEWIKGRGGILAMSRSNRMVDAKTSEQEWIADVLLAKTPTLQRNRIMSRINAAFELQDNMQKEIEAAKVDFPKRQQQKMEDAAKLFEEGKNEAILEAGEIAKRKEVPAGASPEMRKAIANHNIRVDKAEKAFMEWLKTGNQPKQAAKVLVKAAQSLYLLERNQELEEEVQNLRQRYEKVKSAGVTSNIGSPSAEGKPAEPSKMDQLKQTDAQAFDATFKP